MSTVVQERDLQNFSLCLKNHPPRPSHKNDLYLICKSLFTRFSYQLGSDYMEWARLVEWAKYTILV